MRVALLVPDGAGSFTGATLPAIDAVAGRGLRLQVQPTPEGFNPGTEVGFATLLGLRLQTPPSRGRMEAAAAGIDIGPDQGAWRLDVLPAGELSDDDLARLGEAVGEVGGSVHRLDGHRCLLIGPSWWGDAPPGPHQTDRKLREFAIGPFGGVAKAAKAALYPRIAWPWGALGDTPVLTDVPRRLGCNVTVVPGSPVARGIALLSGCAVTEAVPSSWDGVLVVHDARPDEAAHAKDPQAYARALEAFDAEVVAPLADADATVIVCADHGTDPSTGRHIAGPVDALVGGARDAARTAQPSHGGVLSGSALLSDVLHSGVAA